MAAISKTLNGAWEEKGVIGTRVEIKGKNITVLWRNSPVLKTTFSAVEEGGKVILEPAGKGLRYTGAYTDYATVESIVLKDEKLEFKKIFPITGESLEVLTKTQNSRYGAYDIEDGVLKELKGTWKSDDGRFEIAFSGNMFVFENERRKVHVLKPKNATGSTCYIIADEDPSQYDFNGFSRPEYSDGVIRMRMKVCDAPQINIVLRKVK